MKKDDKTTVTGLVLAVLAVLVGGLAAFAAGSAFVAACLWAVWDFGFCAAFEEARRVPFWRFWVVVAPLFALVGSARTWFAIAKAIEARK